jgi:hypothetical protein
MPTRAVTAQASFAHTRPVGTRVIADAFQPAPVIAAILLGLGVGLAIFGQHGIVPSTPNWLPVAAYVLGLALFACLDELACRKSELLLDGQADVSVDGPGATHYRPDLRLLRGQWNLRLLLLATAVFLSLVTWTSMRGHSPQQGYLGTSLVWIGSLAAAYGAAVAIQAPSTPGRGKSSSLRPHLVLLSVCLLALLTRVIALDRVPFTFGGDEGSQAMSAVAVLSGELKNPFGTGWYSVPTLFFFLQAAGLALLGDSVAGARLVPALIGVAAVAVTFLLTRRLFGAPAAVVAALLLATFHYHVHFSRLASNQIGDSLAIVVVLYTLDRAIYERRPLDGLLGGFAIGMSQYFSFAGRVIPLIALAYVVVTQLAAFWRLRGAAHRPGVSGISISILAWILLGAAITYAPLAAHFADNPQTFTARTDQVSMFSSGWLEREMRSTGRGALDLVAGQIRRAALLPFQTTPGGWYINHRPFIGLPVAVVLAFGLTITTLAFWRRPYRGLAIAYWASAIGLGLTEDPTQTQRFVLVSSIMAVMCAVAIVATARIALNLARWSSGVVYTGTAVVVIGLMSWNLLHYFGPTDAPLYGDMNSQTATELAYYLRSLPAGTTVYFLAPPRMFYGGFQSLAFIARGARGVDVIPPLTDGSPPPALSGPTVFAALPERMRELDVAQRWFPNGELRGLGSGRDPLIWVYAPPPR